MGTNNSAVRTSAKPTERLSKFLTRQADKTDRRYGDHSQSLASAALLDLFEEDRGWWRLFEEYCQTRIFCLTAQAWQFHDELRDRGHEFESEEVEGVLLTLARDLLPESAATEWNVEWAHELCKSALSTLASHYSKLSVEEKDVLDLSAQDAWEERMTAASLNNDPAAFRVALRGWEQAGLEALNRVRVKGGAA